MRDIKPFDQDKKLDNLTQLEFRLLLAVVILALFAVGVIVGIGIWV